MKSEKPDNSALKSQASTEATGDVSRATDTRSAERQLAVGLAPAKTEFADMFSLLADAGPDDVDSVVENIREDLQRPRLPEAVTKDIFGEFAASAEDPFGDAGLARGRRQAVPAPPGEPIAIDNARLLTPVAPLLAKVLYRTVEPVVEPDPPSLSEQIMEHLEKSNIAAVSRLRIEVKDGDVVVTGEVPSSDERHLVAHYCRQHPDVRNFVDQMVVVRKPKKAKKAAQPTAPVPRPRAVRYRRTFRLPFGARQIGMTAGLLLMAWTAYSYATRDASKLSVYAVTGKVIFDGQPATGAAVMLHPADRSLTIRPKGVAGADGSFTVTTYLPADGAPAGDYKVTVEWKKPVDDGSGEFVLGPNLLPESYATTASTPLQATVKGKTEIPPIEIKP